MIGVRQFSDQEISVHTTAEEVQEGSPELSQVTYESFAGSDFDGLAYPTDSEQSEGSVTYCFTHESTVPVNLDCLSSSSEEIGETVSTGTIDRNLFLWYLPPHLHNDQVIKTITDTVSNYIDQIDLGPYGAEIGSFFSRVFAELSDYRTSVWLPTTWGDELALIKERILDGRSMLDSERMTGERRRALYQEFDPDGTLSIGFLGCSDRFNAWTPELSDDEAAFLLEEAITSPHRLSMLRDFIRSKLVDFVRTIAPRRIDGDDTSPNAVRSGIIRSADIESAEIDPETDVFKGGRITHIS